MSHPCYAHLLNQMESRNEVQSQPFTEIYKSFYNLWLKFNIMDSKREEIKHQLAILEHETKEHVDKSDMNSAVFNFRKRLEQLQPYHTSHMDVGTDKLPLTNLSRTIYEQKKLIANQIDEMRLMKEEKITFLERHVEIEANLRHQISTGATLTSELAAALHQLQESKESVARLELECSQLVQRILSDKVRAVDDMNDLNARLEERNSLRLDQTERVSVASEPSDRQRTLSITSLGSQQAALLTKESLPVMVSHTVQCHSPETEVNDLLGVTTEGEELLLVTGGDDSSVTIRDLSMEVNSSVTLSGSGSVTSRTLLCGGSVLCLDYTALSLDRVSLLLGASADHSVRVWNIASGKLKCSLTTFTAAVTCARFLGAHSEMIATGSLDRNLKLWDISSSSSSSTGKGGSVATLWTVKTEAPITALAVDSNNIRMFTGHSDGSIVSYDVNSGQKLSTLLNAAPGPTALITCLQTHSSGYLLSMSKEGVAGLFETRGGRVVHKFKDVGFIPARDCSKAAFSPQGQYIACGGSDGTIRIWSTMTGLLVSTLKNTSSNTTVAVVSLYWSANGVLCAGDASGTVTFWR